MEKKRRLKLNSKCNQAGTCTFKDDKGPINIQPEDVVTMAHALGLSYNGPISELMEKIEAILATQKQNWDANNA